VINTQFFVTFMLVFNQWEYPYERVTYSESSLYYSDEEDEEESTYE
jgi:hypothetical protein